ncbi:MAG: fatty acid desaturase [Aestuariivita sp.]|nr:fatty acid desaturase [Aestuariivita sp.]
MIWLIYFTDVSIWSYLISVYIGLGLLKIRAFLEHQAHELVRERTVIVEDQGLFSLLFFNNNLYFVHHNHSQIPWYQFPAFYRKNKARDLNLNNIYKFYGVIILGYFFSTKDQIPYPFFVKLKKFVR